MTIEIVRPADRDLQEVEAGNQAPAAAKLASRKQVISLDQPYVQLNRVNAGTSVPAHSHAEPEAMIVLSGTVVVNGIDCEAGTILVIPANEEYGFEVGPHEPLEFVVVRQARADFQPSKPAVGDPVASDQ
jgi:quercetin dioxygenase-like cupin family protein